MSSPTLHSDLQKVITWRRRQILRRCRSVGYCLRSNCPRCQKRIPNLLKKLEELRCHQR
jgi:hypothetical protein